jgi:hypothetical protein
MLNRLSRVRQRDRADSGSILSKATSTEVSRPSSYSTWNSPTYPGAALPIFRHYDRGRRSDQARLGGANLHIYFIGRHGGLLCEEAAVDGKLSARYVACIVRREIKNPSSNLDRLTHAIER